MRYVAILLLAFYAGQTLATECISPEAREALLKKIQMSVVQMDTPSDDEGSGFLIKTSQGTELVTAHHAINHMKGEGVGCDAAPGISHGLHVPTVNFEKGQPRKQLKPIFNESAANFSKPDDIIKTKLDGLNYKTLEAQSGDRLPAMDEEIIIAGHPRAKNEKYMQHHCRFKGYTESVASDKHAAYALRCGNVSYDLAGMSSGVAISACTGKVIGALSGQDYDHECDRRGDKQHVIIAPLSLNAGGEVVFGLPKSAGATVCWYEDKAKGRTNIERACNVAPNGGFPPLKGESPLPAAPAANPANTNR